MRLLGMHILPESHLDHGITPQQQAWFLQALSDRTGFFIATLELPPELGTVPCGLYGPAMGDPPIPDDRVTLAPRGERAWPSRLIVAFPRPTRLLTVIAGPEGDHPCALYTAFGGPHAPREPGDPSLAGHEAQLAESRAFWAEHALASETPTRGPT